MFGNIIENIKQVLVLAEQREEARKNHEAQFGVKKWGVYLDEEKALNDYLMQLERDTLEILEVLMLLGRDEVHHHAHLSAMENYQELKQARYHHHPDQSIAVYYLTGKRPLKEYIENGLAYLEIVL